MIEHVTYGYIPSNPPTNGERIAAWEQKTANRERFYPSSYRLVQSLAADRREEIEYARAACAESDAEGEDCTDMG